MRIKIEIQGIEEEVSVEENHDKLLLGILEAIQTNNKQQQQIIKGLEALKEAESKNAVVVGKEKKKRRKVS